MRLVSTSLQWGIVLSTALVLRPATTAASTSSSNNRTSTPAPLTLPADEGVGGEEVSSSPSPLPRCDLNDLAAQLQEASRLQRQQERINDTNISNESAPIIDERLEGERRRDDPCGDLLLNHARQRGHHFCACLATLSRETVTPLRDALQCDMRRDRRERGIKSRN